MNQEHAFALAVEKLLGHHSAKARAIDPGAVLGNGPLHVASSERDDAGHGRGRLDAASLWGFEEREKA